MTGCVTESRRLEEHHIAPLQVFGGEGRLYGTTPLCPPHHLRWHRVMVGYTWTGDAAPPAGLDRNAARRAERASRRLDDAVPMTADELVAVRTVLAIMRGADHDSRFPLPPRTVSAIRERHVSARWPELTYEALRSPGGAPVWAR